MSKKQRSNDQKLVLLVDDDPEILEIFSVRCQSLGLLTRTATSVVEALMIMDQKKPDLLMVDINMPFTNGLSFLERLGEDPEAKLIPTIVLTGCKELTTSRRVNDMCAYYVCKSPEPWPKIQIFIHELIDLSQTQLPTISVPSVQPDPTKGSNHDQRKH